MWRVILEFTCVISVDLFTNKHVSGGCESTNDASFINAFVRHTNVCKNTPLITCQCGCWTTPISYGSHKLYFRGKNQSGGNSLFKDTNNFLGKESSARKLNTIPLPFSWAWTRHSKIIRSISWQVTWLGLRLAVQAERGDGGRWRPARAARAISDVGGTCRSSR